MMPLALDCHAPEADPGAVVTVRVLADCIEAITQTEFVPSAA
jgi:hypothetical protein